MVSTAFIAVDVSSGVHVAVNSLAALNLLERQLAITWEDRW